MKTLIENAWILTMDEQMTEHKNGWLLMDGTRIAALGDGAYTGECDRRVDAKGGIVIPGFVNTHCHVSMVPFRTMGDDCPDRLRRFLFPLENEAMTRELVYHAARYGMAEMLLCGITTFVDMYYFEDEVARACAEMGMCGYLGETVIGQSTCDSPEPYGGFALAERMLTEYAGHPTIHAILSPHGTTTCDADCLRRCHDLAAQYDTFMTLHVSEMDYEMTHFAERGLTPLEYMHSLGAVDKHLLAAHCIHLTDGDVALLAESGASVAHCIGSNTKAGKGVAPVKRLAQAGVPYGLGTDGPSSGNTLSLFDQMRSFARFHKTANHERGLFPAKEIVRAATAGGAEALRGQREYGMLKPGLRADVVVVSNDSVSMFPVYNPYSALVYSAGDRDVQHVWANGKHLVENGCLTRVTLSDLRAALEPVMRPFTASAQQYADII